MTKRMQIGVIADEFFDRKIGRMGGFGWAARQLTRIFTADPSQGVDLVFLSGELRSSETVKEARVHDTRVILRQPGRLANWITARRERFDLLLTIDYNLGYTVYLRSLPRTPAIIWVRDPRSPDDARRINTVRIPGQPDETPQGLYSFDSRSIARIHSESHWLGRPLLFATPALHLVGRLEGAYGLEPEYVSFLPNDVRLNPHTIKKSERPTVVFLARLDSYKRPWVFAELARFFPDVEFRFLGQSHFSGPGAWRPENLPPNVRLCGHVDEDEKTRLLSEAWVAVNTSVHEGMPVSFLEALACETPFLSGIDPGFAIGKFGIITGRTDGDGMQGLDAFRHGLERLLGDDRLRRGLGERGREWVRAVHNREHFLECFDRLCQKAGVAR
jgi:glycosyltransferase involved in cell wall biosynthesis